MILIPTKLSAEMTRVYLVINAKAKPRKPMRPNVRREAKEPIECLTCGCR